VPGEIGKLVIAVGFVFAARRMAAPRRRPRVLRLADILVSSFFLVLAFPLFILLTVVVMIAFGRPVLARVTRNKPSGQPYTVSKFRVPIGCSSGNESTFSRIVRRGLMETSLVELPMFFAVLRGDACIFDVGNEPLE
jgi:lipopolysaccharide/colanic/teichoic acid biosynthesis glycosyltransferase